MVKLKTTLPSPAMCVALVALTVSLAGNAIAASGLITGAQIKDHSIGLNDISRTAVTHLHGLRGPQGPEGISGSNGLDGTNGTFDPAKLRIIQGTSITVNPGQVLLATATCPAGSYGVGGGGYASIGKMTLTGPGANGGQGWTIGIYNDTSITITAALAYAVCATP